MGSEPDEEIWDPGEEPASSQSDKLITPLLIRNNSMNNKGFSVHFKIDSFGKQDIGPYYIFIEGTSNLNIGNFHPMAIGRKIKKECPPNVKDAIKNISFLGIKKIKIEFSTGTAANAFLASNPFASESYKTYIPNHLVTRQGVIKHVDVSLDEMYLLNEIISPVEILNVKRITRKNINNSEQFVPTPSVILTFRGKYLPENVTLDYTKCKVAPLFKKVVQCSKCLIFGHFATQCRSKRFRCERCAGNHESSTCESEDLPTCIYCENPKMPHKSTDKKCPRFLLENNINKHMAYKNIPYKEAKLEITTKSYYQALVNLEDSKEFPELNQRSNNSKSCPNYSIRNKSSSASKTSKRKAENIEINHNKLNRIDPDQALELTNKGQGAREKPNRSSCENQQQIFCFGNTTPNVSYNSQAEETPVQNNEKLINNIIEIINKFLEIKLENRSLTEEETKLLIIKYLNNI